jgi:hypothetical protein
MSDPTRAEDEKLVAEWRAAMEGVTPGPWYSEAIATEGAYGSGEDTTEGFDSYVVRTEAQKHYGEDAVICDALNSGTAEVHEEFDEEGTHAWDEPGRCNMAWIARCSPSGIASLLAIIERQGGELAAQDDALIGERWHADEAARQRDVAVARATAAVAEAAGLREAVSPLVDASYDEMHGPECADDPDDEHVASCLDENGKVVPAGRITFGMIRRARSALSLPRMEADNAG